MQDENSSDHDLMLEIIYVDQSVPSYAGKQEN
jgi:hypothetical protein